jgi:starvation-inducible DNA-binding protein
VSAEEQAFTRRAEVLRLLGVVLADEVVLAGQARAYAWNVVGPQSLGLRPLFRAQHEELERLVDEVAERVRDLGGVPAGPGALRASARLVERPEAQPDARDMVAHLLADHQAVAERLTTDAGLCEQCGDRATGVFLDGLRLRHDRLARALRALLEAPAHAGGEK